MVIPSNRSESPTKGGSSLVVKAFVNNFLCLKDRGTAPSHWILPACLQQHALPQEVYGEPSQDLNEAVAYVTQASHIPSLWVK